MLSQQLGNAVNPSWIHIPHFAHTMPATKLPITGTSGHYVYTGLDLKRWTQENQAKKNHVRHFFPELRSVRVSGWESHPSITKLSLCHGQNQ